MFKLKYQLVEMLGKFYYYSESGRKFRKKHKNDLYVNWIDDDDGNLLFYPKDFLNSKNFVLMFLERRKEPQLRFSLYYLLNSKLRKDEDIIDELVNYEFCQNKKYFQFLPKKHRNKYILLFEM